MPMGQKILSFGIVRGGCAYTGLKRFFDVRKLVRTFIIIEQKIFFMVRMQTAFLLVILYHVVLFCTM